MKFFRMKGPKGQRTKGPKDTGRLFKQNIRTSSSLFTLVEVTMAIGVIALGMMGIMALFPIGFQASRNAIGDNYSSELADQFLQVIAMQCKMYEDTDGNGDATGEVYGWNDWINGGTAKIPTAKPDDDNLKNISETAGTATKGSALINDLGIYY